MFQLPRWDEHLSVIGQNGSGKTQLAAWVLSLAHFERMPYVIIDFKREPLFAKVRGIKQLGLFNGKPPWHRPRRPGLYILQPQPWEDDAVEDFLYSVWAKGKCGLWFDEAHILKHQEKGAFQALLTQGRSKRIPLIVLTQKPSWVSRFVFSEAKYFSVFHLNDERDAKVVENFVPRAKLEMLSLHRFGSADWNSALPRYCSYWYDTGQRELFDLLPVPDAQTITATLDARLPRRWL